jgi:hypothetical protein
MSFFSLFLLPNIAIYKQSKKTRSQIRGKIIVTKKAATKWK